MAQALCAVLALVCVTPSALAQETEASREEAMFGESTDEVDEDAMFGGGDAVEPERPDESITKELSEKLEQADDELAIGGFMFLQLNYNIPEEGGFDAHSLSAPNLIDLYLDARPNDRVRAYVRGRLLYNYTRPAESAQPDADALDAGALAFSAGLNAGSQLDVQLDQLWLKFDIARKLYVTLGRQRIRWGAGQFWNPTDFLNANQINPLALFDQRLGVDLLKLHLPLEGLGWNFYAIASLGEADSLDDIGGALRGEFLLGPAELALTFAARRQTFAGPTAIEPIYVPEQEWPKTTTPLRLGADVSSALGPFDVRLEAALTNQLAQPFYRGEFVPELTNLSLPEDYTREDDWILQVVASADIILEYGDGDSLILGGEYFYNDAGYDDSELFLWLALQGGLRPLYMGRHYAALLMALPSPGSLDDSSFSLSAIANLSDGSFISFFNYSLNLLTDLSFNVSTTYSFGNNGEFHYRAEIPAIPGQTDEPFVLPAPRLGLSAGLRMSF